MKKLLLIASLMTLSFISYSQDTVGLKLPVKDGKLVYESVIDVAGKSKMDLYNNAKQWFVDYFKSSKDVIQNEDKDQGRIIGKGVILIPWKTLFGTGDYNGNITIQVDTKDNKYRYKIYDIVISSNATYISGVGKVPSQEFTPEELINKLNGTGKAILSKKQCRKFLDSIDFEVKETITSLITAMNAKADNF